jgi:hypothetical protein
MTVDEIFSDALAHFNEPNNSQFNKDSGALGRRIVNRVYREVCRRAHCAITTGTITTESGTREYSLPAGLVGLRRVEEAAGHKLDRIDLDDISQNGGPPEKYYQLGASVIGFDPLPNGVYTVNLWYYLAPVDELAGADTPVFVSPAWHHVITYGTVYQLFKIDKGDMSSGAVKWQAYYEEELQAFKRFLQEDSNADAYTGVR